MKESNADVPTTESVCAPFAGVVRLEVEAGQTVQTGDVVAVVEAVKLEAPVLAPCPATVESIPVENFSDVTGGDVVAELSPLQSTAAKDSAR